MLLLAYKSLWRVACLRLDTWGARTDAGRHCVVWSTQGVGYAESMDPTSVDSGSYYRGARGHHYVRRIGARGNRAGKHGNKPSRVLSAGQRIGQSSSENNASQ